MGLGLFVRRLRPAHIERKQDTKQHRDGAQRQPENGVFSSSKEFVLRGSVHPSVNIRKNERRIMIISRKRIKRSF